MKFLVLSYDSGEDETDARTVAAFDAESAAEKVAGEDPDAAEDGVDSTYWVRPEPPGAGDVVKVIVECRIETTFHGRRCR